ncbi:MAG: hypothetical protein A3C44_03055 [Gammaproteobacteria bacterium RIFCSPHIGHO2_02_FULL_39_13]|nr:MAG: hypothetical protein A3C44_03055 [Gammaproteobacteria bacterium RIFCSPHIGHO2_02_FULL_39_13]OGT50322.1 MAG: hypothetical protein A3E53_01045 [Gammaproteobacteria bacterium RIFCSPHIGHO2_12_FULL_39_24]
MPLDNKTICIYNCNYSFEWDENKRLSNLEKHNLDFFDAHELWDSSMLIADDQRKANTREITHYEKNIKDKK